MTTPWNAAHWRQNTYRRYKPVAPVGERHYVNSGAAVYSDVPDRTAKCCGYHVCDCVIAVPPHGCTEQGVPILYNSYMKRGEAMMLALDTSGGCVAHVGVITTKQLEKLKKTHVQGARGGGPYARAIDKKLETLAQQAQLYGLSVGMQSALHNRAQAESHRQFNETIAKFDATLRKAMLDEVLSGEREP